MKTKVNKIVKLAAAGLFILALAINVKVTLDDPFVMLSEQAIATGSSSNDTSSGGDWEVVPTKCKCKISGKILGDSNDCTLGFSSCTDNDCSAYSVDDC